MGILSRRLKQVQKEEEFMRSVDLVKQINFFRNFERELLLKNGTEEKDLPRRVADKSHKKMMEKMREYNETMKLISEPELGPSNYKDSRGKMQTCFLLSEIQAKMFMASESFIVQRLVEKEFEQLILENKIMKAELSEHHKAMDDLKIVVDELEKPAYYSRVHKWTNEITNKIMGTNYKKKEEFQVGSEEFEMRVEVLTEFTSLVKEKGRLSGVKKLVEDKFL